MCNVGPRTDRLDICKVLTEKKRGHYRPHHHQINHLVIFLRINPFHCSVPSPLFNLKQDILRSLAGIYITYRTNSLNTPFHHSSSFLGNKMPEDQRTTTLARHLTRRKPVELNSLPSRMIAGSCGALLTALVVSPLVSYQ